MRAGKTVQGGRLHVISAFLRFHTVKFFLFFLCFPLLWIRNRKRVKNAKFVAIIGIGCTP